MSQEGLISRGSSLVENISPQTSVVRMAHGIHTTVAASDTLVTGLNKVICCVVSKNDDPIDAAMTVTCDIGDQAGSPAAGSVLIKSWLWTDADASHVVATTHSKDVAWIAFGY